ncbi:rod shape-determining protein MreD [Psychrobacter sp. FDAARGOS_221]|uniref:rod shape-determining protein MreD n=1 Tax=Psychrobacter sp. FDAARGOS_221 TaxID=1975705 RepID=UPI000BB5685C|nr:rod shape-determining protein MreD [Psychrobacter sp. FDAARGOS_221]PNK60334.1 rod shape-determining protein MreD [Psychrobacter sp. FDAARGOS_221]
MMKARLSPGQVVLGIIASFVAASIVNIYPLSLEASVFRPTALIMVLIFWLIYKPRYVGVGTAFIIGIIADLLLDTRLGQQAFSAVIVAFAIRFIGRYLRDLNLSIAWTVATIGLIVFQLTLWLIQYLTQNIFYGQALISLIISIIIWPLVHTALGRFIR